MRVFAGLSALLTVVGADAVYHRVYHPSLQNPKYLERGIISLDPPAVFASETLVQGLKTLSDVVKELGDPSNVFYQVALVPKDDNSFAKLDYSSVKAVLAFLSVVPYGKLTMPILVPPASSNCRNIYPPSYRCWKALRLGLYDFRNTERWVVSGRNLGNLIGCPASTC